MLRVTLDTNTVDRVDEIKAAIAGRAVEVATTTVTHREKPDGEHVGMAVNETGVYGESVYDSGAVYAAAVYETWVLSESALGFCVLGGDESPSAFESILRIISNGSFPPSASRDNLTAGERRQLRDAMILEAHVRGGRDILVSDDRRAFVGHDGANRCKLESALATRIMTVDEFCEFASTLPRE